MNCLSHWKFYLLGRWEFFLNFIFFCLQKHFVQQCVSTLPFFILYFCFVFFLFCFEEVYMLSNLMTCVFELLQFQQCGLNCTIVFVFLAHERAIFTEKMDFAFYHVCTVGNNDHHLPLRNHFWNFLGNCGIKSWFFEVA